MLKRVTSALGPTSQDDPLKRAGLAIEKVPQIEHRNSKTYRHHVKEIIHVPFKPSQE
jgi:hypothetical protein